MRVTGSSVLDCKVFPSINKVTYLLTYLLTSQNEWSRMTLELLFSYKVPAKGSYFGSMIKMANVFVYLLHFVTEPESPLHLQGGKEQFISA